MAMDNKLLIKLYLLFIPIAFLSYLFHEFGHWIIGEILGNDILCHKYHVPAHGDSSIYDYRFIIKKVYRDPFTGRDVDVVAPVLHIILGDLIENR